MLFCFPSAPRVGINFHPIAEPRHDQNLINWPGSGEFPPEAVYFPTAAAASALLPAFPAISAALPACQSQISLMGCWGKRQMRRQLVTRLHTNYRCKSHLIENNLKWYRHWRGASCRHRWQTLFLSIYPSVFNATDSLTWAPHLRFTHKGHVQGLLPLRAKCLCLARIKGINQIASAQSAIREAFHFICQLKALQELMPESCKLHMEKHAYWPYFNASKSNSY